MLTRKGVLALFLMLLEMLPICPAPAPVTSEFGYRRDPLGYRRRHHNGLDLGTPVGTQIKAMWDGKVVFTIHRRRKGFGTAVMVRSGSYTILYAHLDSVDVRKGEVVTKGQVLGRSGKTGRVTGPHLHWEMRHRGKLVDPAPFRMVCR
jgi:murein DD-endopeptidase MepM/ murein hydrolase activator NlpD